MRYGLNHPKKESFSKDLLRYGDLKADAEIKDAEGNDIRIRCIRYNNKVWFHHMENGEILEIFSM